MVFKSHDQGRREQEYDRMKFKITAEVEIDDESSHLPVTYDSASKKKEGEKVISDIIKDLLYDMDDIEINSIKVTKI